MKEKKPLIKKPLANKTTVKKARVEKPAVKKTEEKAPISLIALYNLRTPFGAHKKRKLLGRGPGSGHGKTSTRGSKGQTSRAGRHFYLGFEGGQSPLIRKMPKRGFVSNFRKSYQIINLEELNAIKDTVINPQLLADKGLIHDASGLVKILGSGSIKNPVTVQAHAFSKNASAQIVSAGGKAEIIKV